MTRLSFLARNPKRTLGSLTAVLAATALTAGSGAYFADSATSESNAVEAGTVAITTFGSDDRRVDANGCRDGRDVFEEPAGYVDECFNPAVDLERGATRASFRLEHLVPVKGGSLLRPGLRITRCLAVRNDGDVPAALRAKVNIEGGSSKLADVLQTQVVGFNVPVRSLSQLAGHLPFGGEGSLSELAGAGPVIADKRILGNRRLALEPGQVRPYCFSLRVLENDLDQHKIESDKVRFDISFLATSLAGDQARVDKGDYTGALPVVKELEELRGL